jgi:hypothetical protein
MDALLKPPKRNRNDHAPTGVWVDIVPRDIEILRLLYEHGPLPTAYLHALTKDQGADLTRLKKRIGMLFHERDNIYRNWLLERPPQLNPRSNLSHFVVSEVGATGLRALDEEGLLALHAKASAGGNYAHMFMSACITAAIEAQAKSLGFRYVSRREILADAGLDQLSFKAPISYKGERYEAPLKPDAIFALENAKGRLYFLLEADRNNEPVRRKDFSQTSYLRKVLQYRSLIATSDYKRQLKIDQQLVVLTVTTNRAHMLEIMQVVKAELDSARYLLFTHQPEFGGVFRVPGLITDLLTRQWDRVGYDPFIIGGAQ